MNFNIIRLQKDVLDCHSLSAEERLSLATELTDEDLSEVGGAWGHYYGKGHKYHKHHYYKKHHGYGYGHHKYGYGYY